MNLNQFRYIILLFVLAFFILNPDISGAQKENNYFIHVGHSTVLLHLDNVNILIDPIWNDVAFLNTRSSPPGIKITDLPPIDVILITHGHFDHFDLYSLDILTRRDPHIKIYMPLKLSQYMKQLKFTNYYEINTNDMVKIKDILIQPYCALHPGSRFFFDDSFLSFSYLIKGTRVIFFSGDTGYFDLFKKLGEKEEIDLAFLEIQGWKITGPDRVKYYSYYKLLFKELRDSDDVPEYLPMHLHPDQAIKAMIDLKAEKMVPIHYNTFFTHAREYRSQAPPLSLLKEAAAKASVEDKIIIEKFGKKIYIE